jgi:hypothetical protein
MELVKPSILEEREQPVLQTNICDSRVPYQRPRELHPHRKIKTSSLGVLPGSIEGSLMCEP